MEKDLLIEIGSSKPEYKDLEDDILRALKKALKIMDKSETVVEVGLLSKEEMAKVNKSFRDKEGPTNVLSFSETDKSFGNFSNFSHLGEIYLCPDVIGENGDDIIYLSIHGLLHLIGYTHKDKSDTMKMEKKEEELLDKIRNE